MISIVSFCISVTSPQIHYKTILYIGKKMKPR